MDYKELSAVSRAAQKYSYSPYSNITVGAALLTKEGRVYTGCNVESASYGATICAERTAIVKAVSEGEREFEAIAVSSNLNGHIYPCGICRQSLAELAPGIKIILSDKNGGIIETDIDELLPNAFK